MSFKIGDTVEFVGTGAFLNRQYSFKVNSYGIKHREENCGECLILASTVKETGKTDPHSVCFKNITLIKRSTTLKSMVENEL